MTFFLLLISLVHSNKGVWIILDPLWVKGLHFDRSHVKYNPSQASTLIPYTTRVRTVLISFYSLIYIIYGDDSGEEILEESSDVAHKSTILNEPVVHIQIHVLHEVIADPHSVTESPDKGCSGE